ncbi:MAG: TFIIB-type zinc ribbon-containing protein [Planctomycetota bacterium]|jgi:Zn-finger nucleic acid-binding protein
MKCPACFNELQEVVVGDVNVEVCKGGCGGMWFDNFEVKKFDEGHETGGEELLDVEKNPSVSVDRSQRLNCPKCDEIVMMRHFFSIKNQVEVDECAGCGGIWLDAGELAQIREQFETEEERKQAAHDYFKDVFAKHFSEMEAENEAKLAKTRRIAKMFRFICPSYYVPGKQDWGAH